MPPFQLTRRAATVVLLMVSLFTSEAALSTGALAADPLHSLDEYSSAYHVGLEFPKLTTPQWIGEEGVDAVVVLAIDDMRDTAKYESYLRPILQRLQAIDGRAPVSIMTNRVDPRDPQIAQWLKEGLSIEVHTYDHPCPCLKDGDFAKAKGTYERCVDLLSEIPNSHPVAFRMPCCDSLNTPSPRFWAEIFNKTTPQGNYLTIDTSVFQIFTADDPALPAKLVTREDGNSRFRHYIPFESFVNTIENYPYPYLIGGKCWQFPCVVPSDWSAQHVQKPNNPDTIRDWKRALDATVIKQGTFNLVFHPHGWIRNDQVVELIDYSESTYGKRVKFLTFREASDRLKKHLLSGGSIRDKQGRDAGVRLIDLNSDGYLDVVRPEGTRLWQPAERTWSERRDSIPTIRVTPHGVLTNARFGRTADGTVFALWQVEDSKLFRSDFRDGAWSGSETPTKLPARLHNGQIDLGLRLRDLDGDGVSELLANPDPKTGAVEIWRQADRGWQRAGFSLPSGASVTDAKGQDAGLRLEDIDGDGLLDSLFSDLKGYRLDLLRRGANGQLAGWTVNARQASREEKQEIPVISRGGENNGAWFHSDHLWIQNEQTSQLPNLVDRRSYTELLGELADIPPPRTPQRSLESFSLSIPGEVQLVAAEPLVADPVAFDWAPDGRLWVAEMADYPLGIDGQGKPGGRVRVLTDRDGDGRYDESVVFLEGLPFPNGIKVWRDGVIVSTAPDVFFAADDNGDQRADRREVLFTGFAPGNQQHRVNGLRWGLDNWLYLANGDSGGTVTSTKTGMSMNISGRDLRIRPDTGEMDTVAGQTQFGRNRDDWGNWFGGNNSNPGWHYVLDATMLRRNPHVAARSPRLTVTNPPGAAPIYPRSRTLTRFNDFNRADRFTSACSHSIYRDEAWSGMRGDFLVCEPVHNLVHRQRLTADGVTFVGSRAQGEQSRELLASTDNWFRPVMVRTGPEGGIWVADMYRLVIEHPEWIPKVWQDRLDLRAGEDAGRIYRIVPPNRGDRGVPTLHDDTVEDLVRRLEDPNGWVRDMAHQRLLWEGEDMRQGAADRLKQLLATTRHPWARVHAISVLAGLERLDSSTLNGCLTDSNPLVRAHASRMARDIALEDALIDSIYRAAREEKDPRVLIQIAYLLGEIQQPAAAQALAALAKRTQDPWLTAAILSSIRADTLPVFAEALRQKSVTTVSADVRLAVLRMSAATGNWRVAAEWVSMQPRNESDQRVLLQNLGQLLRSNPESLPAEAAQAIHAGLRTAREIANNASADIQLRVAALDVLGRHVDRPTDRDLDLKLAEQLLTPTEPPTIQRGALRLILRAGGEQGRTGILATWRSLTPSLRQELVDTLLQEKSGTRRLVERIVDGTIRRNELGARAQQLLRESADPDIRKQVASIWTENSSRQDVVHQFLADVQSVGDVQRGKAVFAKHCAACHRLQGVGHDVAPNLAALTDRSTRALLTAILDPNRAVEDKYVDYLVVTADGKTHRGILGLESDTHVVLIGADGKRTELARNAIEELTSSGQSLMPVGLERQINVAEMSDLIAFLQKTRIPYKTFAGNEPKVAPLRDDGSARLLATDCRIYGPTVIFEAGYRNLGFWGSEQDTAVWEVNLPRAGKYRVTLDYACDNGTAGNRFHVEAAGEILTGEVEGTGTWDNYRSKGIGTITLPAGSTEVTMRSDGPIQSFLFDLRGITLSPVD